VNFLATPLPDAFVIELKKKGDDRVFCRCFCGGEFRMQVSNAFVQMNNSLISRPCTLRGLHYQLTPAAEVKVVALRKRVSLRVTAIFRPTPRHSAAVRRRAHERNRFDDVRTARIRASVLTLSERHRGPYMVSACIHLIRAWTRLERSVWSINWPCATKRDFSQGCVLAGF